MATPRRRAFKVAESVLHSSLTAEDVGIQVKLWALVNARRARETLSPAEAERVLLHPADLHAITGRSTARYAAQRLRRAFGPEANPERIDGGSDLCSFSIQNGSILAFLPKWAEFQGDVARVSGNGRANAGHASAFEVRRRRRRDSKASEGGDSQLDERQAAADAMEQLLFDVGAGVPDRLAKEDRERFSRWLHKHYPPLWPQRYRLERACLQHYREHPTRAAAMRSWLAACEGWAKGAWDRQRSQRSLWPHAVEEG